MTTVIFYKIKLTLASLLIAILYMGCHSSTSQTDKDLPMAKIDADTFAKKWYSGTAEIVTFDLNQARYGEMHHGTATMIFVTEDFSKSKQVKLDNPNVIPSDAVKIMKLNFARKFNTGIYPYSTMTSVFTPVSNKPSLKITCSVQEWCGNAFIQLNRTDDDDLRFREFSYFESEGDSAYNIATALLEDEVFNIIRLGPQVLPLGKLRIIPSALSSRFGHYPMQTCEATAELNMASTTPTAYTYTVSYKTLPRIFSVSFSPDFPYNIISWTEQITDSGGKTKTTTATAIRTMQVDYWTKNKNENRTLREKLGLSPDFQ